MKKLLQVLSYNSDVSKTINKFYSSLENVHDRMKRLECYNMSNNIQFRDWDGKMSSLND